MAQKALTIDLTTGDVIRTADLVEASEVKTVPTLNSIPRADVYAKIDAGWIPILSISQLPVAADGENSNTKLVRADDSRFGNPAVGGDLSGTVGSATVIKLRGRSIANVSPANGQVLTWNTTTNQYEPTTPTTGAALTITDGTTTVPAVSTIHVGAVTDNGGGDVTVAGGTGGSGKSAATRLYLYRNFR